MTDLESILPLWRELESSRSDYVLATVVAVEGSSYRKPGARMLLAPDGRREGTVSGGCLESEIARRAWWLTSSGPTVEQYSTVDDDGKHPYGSGCGGIISLLLERRPTAGPLLAALEMAFHARIPFAVATVLNGPHTGHRAFVGLPESADERRLPITPFEEQLQDLGWRALNRRASVERTIVNQEMQTRIWIDYRAARPGLWIFGAGDDAHPLARFAQELGWFVTLADGRSHLVTRQRFPSADEVRVLPIADLPHRSAQHLALRTTDAAVVMTHSFEQDSRILASLITLGCPVAYLGVLGPQRRTRELLVEAARLLHITDNGERIDRWLEQMHAPTGLDIGAETPASIALSILAEIQTILAAASGQPLRQVRAAREIVAQC